MLKSICPKLPMRDKAKTIAYYTNKLGFGIVSDHGDYLLLSKEGIEIHFFEFSKLDPHENYGQVYIRTSKIEHVYQKLVDGGVAIHPNGRLQTKPWGQKEFSLLDPDNNLLTFGEGV